MKDFEDFDSDSGDADTLDIPKKPEFLVPRFNTLHLMCQEQIRFNDLAAAKETYERMKQIYEDIKKSAIVPSLEKQKAYGRLMYVFTALSNDSLRLDIGGERQISLSMLKYILPISVVIIVLILIFFLRPEFALSGMAALGGIGEIENSAPEWTGGDAVFHANGITEIDLAPYFSDSDGDLLSYSLNAYDRAMVSMAGSVAAVSPDPMVKGAKAVRICASDRDYDTCVNAVLIINQN